MKRVAVASALVATVALALGIPARPLAAWGPGPWTTGSTGALGDVVYGPGEHVIDLAAVGAYDPVNWRVVLDYVTLTIESGATVRFANHASRAPVVLRAQGEVVIDGSLLVDGEDGLPRTSPPTWAEPGPGGFRGGRGSRWTVSGFSAGFGPGGGFLPPDPGDHGGSGSYRTPASDPGPGLAGPTYGSPSAVPLVGGSGGASTTGSGTSAANGGSGAGGGAILIGSDTRVTISGTVSARGGMGHANAPPPGQEWSGNGSGGAIRVVAPEVRHTAGFLDARGWTASGVWGGDGAVRIETDGSANMTLDGTIYPDPSTAIVLGDFLPTTPRVALIAWWDDEAGAWVPIPSDPRAVFFHPTEADVQLPAPGTVVFRIEGQDVPLGAALHVRTTLAKGQAVVDSAHTMGEVAGSTLSVSWTDVSIDLAQGVSAIQVRAELP